MRGAGGFRPRAPSPHCLAQRQADSQCEEQETVHIERSKGPASMFVPVGVAINPQLMSGRVPLGRALVAALPEPPLASRPIRVTIPHAFRRPVGRLARCACGRMGAPLARHGKGGELVARRHRLDHGSPQAPSPAAFKGQARCARRIGSRLIEQNRLSRPRREPSDFARYRPL